MFCFQLFIENVSYSILVASTVHMATSWPVHAFRLGLLHVSFLSCKASGYIFSLIYNAFEIIRNLNIHFILKGAF